MAKPGGVLERWRLTRAFHRLSRIAASGQGMSAAELDRSEADIERLRQRIDAAGRRVEAARGNVLPDRPVVGPEQCDFAMRPDLWQTPIHPRGATAIPSPSMISPAITVFHDCPRPEVSYRQTRASHGQARYHLALEVYRFGGGFLSLVQNLPEPAIHGLTRAHYISVTLQLTCEVPLEVYGRLNLQSGPNTEKMVRDMPMIEDRAVAEFDLAYTQINEKRMERAWLDIIFEAPQMNRILIKDMTITRAPRADI